MPEPYFRTLQIQQNSRVRLALGRQFPHHPDAPRVVFLSSVRSVQPEYVYSRIKQAPHHRLRIGGGSEGGNDLCGWHAFK